MKLEGKAIWVTGKEIELGEVLDFTSPAFVSYHVQAVVYYDKGLYEFDKLFSPKGYIKNGYVCDLTSYENGFSIVFAKYDNAKPVDMGGAIIERSKIINFEELGEAKVEVVKKQAGKHQAKTFLRKATGVGQLISAFTDSSVSANTEIVNGVKFKLFYLDETDNVSYFTLYSSIDWKDRLQLFLNTYYKKTLSEEAINQVNEDSDSSCFIATACYRDIYSEEVVFFRWYRDNVLNQNLIGRKFIRFYYFFTPYVYKPLFNNPTLSNRIKFFLDIIYRKLSSKV